MTTLVVEDGTGRSDANVYVSQADAVTYFATRAVTTGFAAATSPNQQTALVRAAQYMDAHFSGRWKGYRLQKAQAMAWPRVMSSPLQWSGTPFTLRSMSYLVDADGFPILSNEVPQLVKNANCELANAFALGVDLTPGQTYPLYRSRKAGDTEEVYANSYQPGKDNVLVNTDQMLEPLLISMPGAQFTTVQVVRG